MLFNPNPPDLPSAQNVDTKPGSWQKLIELEKRPLMLTIVLTAVLLLVGMLGTMLFLLLQNQDSFDDHTGDGDDGRPNIPVDSTIGTWGNMSQKKICDIFVAISHHKSFILLLST